jgi:soluble lytic murein transglycosylase-like protein
MTVALAGPGDERPRAALLWGLSACDADVPMSALEAFELADLHGPLARLAARRLADSLVRSTSSMGVWERACAARWPVKVDHAELCVIAAEASAARGVRGAARFLPPDGELSPDQRARAAAVRAREGPKEREAARRIMAVEYPQRYDGVFPDEPIGPLLKTLPVSLRIERATTLLGAGQAEAALREAAALGSRGAAIAARAAIALRRPQTALAWSIRAGDTIESWVSRCNAYRQIAWGSGPQTRTSAFARLAEASATLRRRAAPGSDAAATASVLEAEALTELGRYAQAAEDLGLPNVNAHPRWEWAWRRLVFLSARHGRTPVGTELATRSDSTRDKRLASFWIARSEASAACARRMGEIAAYGLPDLPGLWAAAATSAAVTVELSDSTPGAVTPPAWASDLMTAGRVADVVLAWRLALERGGAAPEQWLGLVRLAALPPLDAVPLLLRGEPRLLAGPWSGLPRWLLEAYLPLPARAAVERAAKQAGVPPWLLAGIVRQESGWNPLARSAAGAVGLTQIMPGTARDIARRAGRQDLIGRSLTDPGVNLALGAFHLAQWFRTYRSWVVAIACHNAGERRVREVWEAAGRRDGPEFVEAIEIPETWDYVHRVVLWAEGYRLLYWPQGRAFPWT